MSQKPAPAVQYGLYGGAESAGMHTVAEGENLWAVSRRYRLPMQDIIRVNGLAPPFILKPEQRIKLPPPRDYAVRPGDSVYTVSRTNDVSVTELARLNDLKAPYVLAVGQVLNLPPPPAPRMDAHVFGAPETRFSIASASMAAPGFSSPAPAGADLAPAGIVEDPSAGGAAPSPAPVQIAALEPRKLKASAVSTIAPSSGHEPALIHGRSDKGFGWPVSGPILSAYGLKEGGLRNDGVNISAPKGAPVHASRDGVVVYAGNRLKGFGNLVLVRHADRWVTAYAHMDAMTVKRGQALARGEVLGTVGSTGGVDGPQLHFEIRRDTEALDPELYLGKRGSS